MSVFPTIKFEFSNSLSNSSDASSLLSIFLLYSSIVAIVSSYFSYVSSYFVFHSDNVVLS